MTIPNWFWPSSGSARGIGLTPYAGGMAVADWSTPQIWPFSVASGTFSSPIVAATGTPGFAGTSTDVSGSIWAVTYGGSLYEITSGGVSSLAYAYPSGYTYVGLVAAGTSGYYAVTSAGKIYGYDTAVASGSLGVSAWFAASSSSLLYSLAPSLSGVGTFPLAGGASGLIALPAALSSPSALTYGTHLAAGGWAVAPQLAAAAAVALNPALSTMLLGVGSGTATTWTSPGTFADAWTQTHHITGLYNLNSLAWRPDGVQALATALTANAVQVLTSSAGSVSLTQSLPVAGACSIAIGGNSVSGLVAQSGQSQVLPISFNGTNWVSGTPLTGYTSIVAVSATGASGMYAAYYGHVGYLSYQTGSWVLNSQTVIGFTPTVLCTDYFGNAYVAGAGAVAQVNVGGRIMASGTWTGNAPTSIAVQQGRIIMAIPGDSMIRVFGLASPGALTQQWTGALAAGSQVGLGLSYTTLFVGGSGSTQTYGFSGMPFALTNVLSGAIATYNGSSWTTYPLGIGHLPSAMTYDAAGNLQVVTAQNTWWTLTTGAVLSSGIVPQTTGQIQGVPLGPSSLLPLSGHLYCATSLAGVLIQLT